MATSSRGWEEDTHRANTPHSSSTGAILEAPDDTRLVTCELYKFQCFKQGRNSQRYLSDLLLTLFGGEVVIGATTSVTLDKLVSQLYISSS